MREAIRAALLAVIAVAAAPIAVAGGSLYDQLPDNRVLYIAPGQTLSGLVPRLYPDRHDEWAGIQKWIVEHNPQAFVDGDPARLRADVRVRLPHPSDFALHDNAGKPQPRVSGLDLRFGPRYLFVDPAQTLGELVPRVYPDQRAHWKQIIDAILARNADVLSASTRSADTIDRGTRLRIPRVVGEPDGQTAPAAPPPPTVGEVAARDGRLVAVDPDGKERVLGPGDAVRRGDMLHTGPDSSAEIHFADGEKVFLRPGSKVDVRDWRLPETGPGTRIVELVEGGLRAITGAISHRDGDDYRMITPNATMGVRGTDYSIRMCESGECRLGGAGAAAVPAGLYVGVAKGRVSVLNSGGYVEYSVGDYGYVAAPNITPAPADADVAQLLYPPDELDQLSAAAGAGGDAPAESDKDDGPSWWWAVGALVVVGAAL